MTSLILKDFLIQKRLLSLILLYYLLFSFLTVQLGNFSLVMLIVMLTFIFTSTFSAYDDKSRADILFNSLPVSRNTIVLAKYISFIIFTVVNVLIMYLISMIIDMLNLFPEHSVISMSYMSGAIMTIMITHSVYLPVLFKFGYIKSRLINFLVFFFVFFSMTLLGNYLEAHPEAVEKVNQMVELYTSLSAGVQFFILLVAVLALLTISYFVSVYFYRKREF